ncbi:hypothetical protein PYW07_001996 [Mythimna separata]|uniref:Protein with SprT-like domain at the N terminus n=1 Tax=Mythimna separata TaxID=271217 RepID=A0AAD7YLZ8_MYTSE|nr:hypothetical protein PYW07_001996 [Mythimna separata]
MNLGDPELELIDPTPNVHSLFIHFDKMFFWTKLESRAVVRWSKRMYSCAGICSYEGRAGICDIALSEPLLKLRPRKDLIETLLHEMIHAFLFVTNRDQDRDGHGPNFKAHMHRINKSAGLNISIYHSFHDEVHLYQTHWWRCNGPCATRKPHFGIVRRTANRAPGPNDYWWKDHLRKCGGVFVKIKEPEKQEKSKGKKTTKATTTKPNADITKYITNNIKTINNVQNNNKPILKDSTNVPANTKSKINGLSNVAVGKKGEVTVPKSPPKPIPVFTGSGHTFINNNTGSKPNTEGVTETVRNIWAKKQINTGSRPYTDGVTETVRNIWANKQIPTKEPVKKVDTGSKNGITSKDTGTFKEPARVGISNPKKHKADPTNLTSPPTKMKKIDDYFNASTILKDLYGDDYKLTQSTTSTKLVAVKVDLVDCPVCSGKFNNEEINRHLDECLNKDIIVKLSKDGINSKQETQPDTKITDKVKLKEIVGAIPSIPKFKPQHPEFIPVAESTNINIIDLTNNKFATGSNIKTEKPTDINGPENNELIDLTHLDFDAFNNNNVNKDKRKTESEAALRSENLVKKVSALVNEMDEAIKSNLNNRRRNTIGLITMDRGDSLSSVVEKGEDLAKPGCSKDEEVFGQNCPCCGKKFDKPVEQHLDECLMFFNNNTTIPDEGASTSFTNTSIEDEEDDIFDESQIFNETGTKTPCPCCMKMVEQDDMNSHLDECLLK